jgi:hypothetical protein
MMRVKKFKTVEVDVENKNQASIEKRKGVIKMSRKAKVVLLAVGIAVLATLAIGTAVFARAPQNDAGVNCVNGGAGLGRGWQGEVSNTAVSDLLGMTSDEICDLRQDGASLVEIAASKNVTEEQLVAAIKTARTAEIQSRVAAGTLTQEQANIMLQNMEQNIVQAVNRESVGPFGNGGSGVCNQSRLQAQGQ